MFDRVDADGSGQIDYSEFVVAAMSQQKLLSQKKLQMAFKMFDKDGGGTITIDEIQEAINFDNSLTEEDLVKIAKEVDANGDGEISFEEFAGMMLSNIN